MDSKLELIIAGSNKCGTTSVFRYLSDHPAVCPTGRKETGFFFADRDYASPAARKEYEALFPANRTRCPVWLEATPSYLDRGARTAVRMKALLTSPRIMFLLRDPAQRFLSHYRSRQGLIGDPATDLSLGEFCRDQLRAAQASDGAGARTDGHDLVKGGYASMLTEYLQVFEPAELTIVFYENLARDPRRFMRDLCATLAIDPDFFDDYVFRIENRSRFHHSSRLRTLATRTNLRLEPLLNRVPAARRVARAAYNAINTSRSRKSEMSRREQGALADYYAGPNAVLRELLSKHFPDLALPTWLR